MAQIRAYKLYSAGTSTASAAATITIPRQGLITSIQWAGAATGGAATSTGMRTELSTSSVSTIGQNDTPGNSLSTFSLVGAVSAGGVMGNSVASNLGIPISQGDKLYLHQTAYGTPTTSCLVDCTITIMH